MYQRNNGWLIRLYITITFMLILFKAAGVIKISWLIVMLPVIVPVALGLIIGIVALIFRIKK